MSYKAIARAAGNCSDVSFDGVPETPISIPFTMVPTNDSYNIVCAIGKVQNGMWQAIPTASSILVVGNTATPTCRDFSYTKDFDNDGLKDGEEFFGHRPPDSAISYRSNFREPDSDFDGRRDFNELNNKKIDGYTVNEQPLTKNFPLSPIHRDFALLVFARGGQNSNQLTDGKGWNSYSGIGNSNTPPTQVKPQNNERIRIKMVNDLSLVNVTKIPSDWRPRSTQNTYENVAGCWRGDYGEAQGGCIGGIGEALRRSTCSSVYECVSSSGNDLISPQSTNGVNNWTRGNSLIGRFSTTGDRLTSETGLRPFPIGHINSTFTADSGRIRNVGDNEIEINPQNNSNQFLLLRSQDSNAGTSNNSGFIVVVVRFINQDPHHELNKLSRPPTENETVEFYNNLRSAYGLNVCTN